MSTSTPTPGTSTPTPGTPPQDAPRVGNSTTPADRPDHRQDTDLSMASENIGHTGHGRRHTWMMLLMCLPMVLLVGALVATGTVGGGAVVYALGCVAMMSLMMLFMSRGHRH